MPFQYFYDQYYVNYWYANYPNATTVVDMIEGLRVSEAYRRQLSNFSNRKRSVLSRRSNDPAFRQWSKFLESTANNQENIIQKATEISGFNVEFEKFQHVDNVLQTITTDDERFSNSVEGMQELVKVANDILNLCFGKEKKEIFDAWVQECLVRYAEEAKAIDGYAENVVRSILGTHSDEFVRINDKGGKYDKLTDANKRLGSLLAALSLLESGMGDTPLDVVRKSTTTLMTGEEIANRIRQSIRGSLQNYSKDAMEFITGLAIEKLSEQLVSKIPGADISTAYTGKTYNRTNLVEVVTHMDPDFQKHIDAINTRRKSEKLPSAVWDRKTSKADFTATLTSTDSETTLTTNIGFSVKSDAKIKISSDGITKADIKLQDGTPLFTFLTRDLGLTSSQMNGLIRLAAGHGSNTKAGGGKRYTAARLDSVWNKLIQYVQAKSLLTALTGVSVVGQSDVLYFVLNGKMFSIGDIIQGAAGVAAQGGSAVKLTAFSEDEVPGLKRSTYYNMNKWVAPREKRTSVAIKRSEEVFGKVVNRMYDTKIKIDLNTSAIQGILRTI